MSSSSDRGDIGRRIERRRSELGLSLEEVASRAGMDRAYLRYIESQPAQVTQSTVVRLAIALETTTGELLGATVDLPSGQGRGAQPGARLVTLTGPECRALLERGGVGRVVFSDDHGPTALPVNFVMVGDDIVFRTAADSPIRAAAHSDRVSFEVDHIDDAMRQGWSVLASGSAREVGAGEELRALGQLGVEPWAGDDRSVYLRIEPDTVTGRRIEGPGGQHRTGSA